MNFKQRKTIYKIPGLHSLLVKIRTMQNNAYFNKINEHKVMTNRLKMLKDSATKKRCFIVGNGPSLTMSDLSLIKNEDCFAANLIFRIFDKTDWRPKYYFIQDPYADITTGFDEMPESVIRFYADSFIRVQKNKLNDKVYCFKTKRCSNKKVKFSYDFSKEVFSHYTITYTMIQAAAYFGYKEIILLGMDHSFSLTVDSKGRVTENKEVVSHIFTDRDPKEVVANLEGMNAAYIKARDVLTNMGISIFNSTRGGKLEWFQRKSLEEVLSYES